MLMAMIENIYETMNLRITETAFELHLRKIYPTRNILSMRETETIAGQECLDVQKKTDGSVNIIGEVATDPVASWMIQSAQVASKFTLFTHHAKTFPNLVTALRNSMLRAGTFKDERTAEEQVVQVLNFDIHLVKDFRGRRYIERITECIPVEEKNEYTFDYRKEKSLEGKFDKFFDNATIFFSKTTNRELYHYRNILEFVDDSYVLVNPISDQNIKEMRNNMEETDAIAFDKFLERNWGIKSTIVPVYDENGNEIVPEMPKVLEERKAPVTPNVQAVRPQPSVQPNRVQRPTQNPQNRAPQAPNSRMGSKPGMVQNPERKSGLVKKPVTDIEDLGIDLDVDPSVNKTTQQPRTGMFKKPGVQKPVQPTKGVQAPGVKPEEKVQEKKKEDDIEDPYGNLFISDNDFDEEDFIQKTGNENKTNKDEKTNRNNTMLQDDDDDEGFDL